MSKRFKFSLQKVLEVRAVLEDKRAEELQKAHAEEEHQHQQLQALQDEKQTLTQTHDQESTSLQALNARTAYLDQLSERIGAQKVSLQQTQECTEQARQAYVQATKDRKVLEKLKASHQAEFMKKNNQTEIMADSEVANRITQQGDPS